MHSHPHGLTHPDKRGCVVYSGQLCRTAKNFRSPFVVRREKSAIVGFSECFFFSTGVFYHTPWLRHFSSHQDSAVLLQGLSRLFLPFFFFFICLNDFQAFLFALFVCLKQLQRRRKSWKNNDSLVCAVVEACEFAIVL